MKEGICFELKLPTSWAELTTAQQLYVFFLLAEGYTPSAVRIFCLLRWSGMKVLKRMEGDRWLIRWREKEGIVSDALIADAAGQLAFLDVPPAMPVRPESIDGHRALPADFMGVPFQTFLCVENLYQGWLHTEDEGIILQMADLLYCSEGIRLSKAEQVAVCFWVISLKKMLAARFCHFFRPVAEAEGNLLEAGYTSAERIQEVMDTQIRALTKGDVTKEAEVLQLDTWRALTELNAQAKEYEDIRRDSK